MIDLPASLTSRRSGLQATGNGIQKQRERVLVGSGLREFPVEGLQRLVDIAHVAVVQRSGLVSGLPGGSNSLA